MAAYAAGSAIGGPVGGAIGSTLFGLLVPSGAPAVAGTSISDLMREGVEPGTPIKRIYGLMPLKGDLIDCGLDKDGAPAAIVVTTKTKKKGGIFGIGGVKVSTEEGRLRAVFGLCEGPSYVEQMRIDFGEGETVVYDRYNPKDSAMPDPQGDPDAWRDFLQSQFDGSAPYRPGSGIQLTPQYAPDGSLIAEISQEVAFYAGTEWQDVDPIAVEWHGSKAVPYRGLAYARFNNYLIKGQSIEVSYLMRNLLDGKTEIIRQSLTECGVPVERVNLSSLSGRIHGCARTQAEAPREMIEKLAALDFHDLMFLDGGFQDVSRLNPATWNLQTSDLGARLLGGTDQAPPPVEWAQKGARELVTTLRLKFVDIDNDYEEGEVVSYRHVAGHENELTLEFPFATHAPEMLRLVDVMLDELWAGNSTEKIALVPRNMAIAPGNVLIYDAGDGLGTRQMRVTKQPSLGADGLMLCESVAYDAGVYGIHRVIEPVVKPRPTVAEFLTPIWALLDLPALSATALDNASLQFAASTALNANWAGAYFDSDRIGDATVGARSPLGTIPNGYSFSRAQATAFGSAPTMRVQMTDRSLVTASLEDVANGANLLAIETESGALLVSILTATPVVGTPRTFDCTVWPGRYGTETFGAVSAGARCVLLSDFDGGRFTAMDAIEVSRPTLGMPCPYIVSSLDESAPVSTTQTITPRGRSLVPPTPGDVRVETLDEGGARITFFPRTRDWEGAAAYWNSAARPRETDDRRFTLRLLDGENVTETHELSFAADAPLPLTVDVANGSGQLHGELWQNGGYARGNVQSF